MSDGPDPADPVVPIGERSSKAIMNELAYVEFHLNDSRSKNFADVVSEAIDSLSEDQPRDVLEGVSRDLGRVYHHLKDLRHDFYAMKVVRIVAILHRIINGQAVPLRDVEELEAVI